MAFAADLKRRKVYRVAAAYGAGAFVLGQAASFVFPALHLPDWTLTLLVVLLILGFPLALGLSWAFDITPEGIRRTPPRALEGAPVGEGHEGPPSVAVLPFVPMGQEAEDEPFSDGLTEEILNGLAGVEGIRVVSRTSSFAFKGRERDIREIARELDADAVLEGSVRRGGGGVRVTAQLIRGSDGFHLFSQTYDRPMDDPVAVQEEVARAVTHAVRKRLEPAGDEGDPAGEAAGPAVEADLARGREFLDERTPEALTEARARFQAALEADPERAEAHAGLAETLALLGDMGLLPREEAFPGALAAARRAVALDEGLARAHAVLGFIRTLTWDWSGVERHFRRALELDPESAAARRWHALFLSATGRLPEAIRESEEVLRLEAGSPGAHTGLAALHFYARRPARALECCRRALEADPAALFPRVLTGMALDAGGDRPRAKAELKKVIARSGAGDPLSVAALARILAEEGDQAGARALLGRLEAAGGEGGAGPVSGFLRASVLAAMGERERALRALDEAVSARDGWLLALQVHPWMDPLRDEEGFMAVTQAVGLGAPRADPVG